MQSKKFIVYPKTKLAVDNPHIEIIDAPIKTKLKAYVTGYLEDYGELPAIDSIRSVFNISKQDAEMALVIYGSTR